LFPHACGLLSTRVLLSDLMHLHCILIYFLCQVDSSQDQNLVDATMVMIGMALRVVRVWLNKERAEGEQ
jgi:hypothetical protein